MDGEAHPREPSSLGSYHFASRGTGSGAGAGRGPSTRDEQRVLLGVRGSTAICLHLVTDESRQHFRWWRNQEKAMAKPSRSRWRSLVGRIKKTLRRKWVLSIALWVFRVLYYVAKLFDPFH